MNLIVTKVLYGLASKEGIGDNVTTIKTGGYGVTEAARKAVGASVSTPDMDVAESYLNLLYDKWKALDGYCKAPEDFQVCLLDNSYNLGPSVMHWVSVVEGLKEGNWKKVAKGFLSSANVGGMSLRGLAVRRAEVWNCICEDKIYEVLQRENGELLYLDSKNNVLFVYKAKNGRHPKSVVGRLKV